MEKESFESEEIANIMNDSFVNVKVDREVLPDVDRVYMTFVQATIGHGGWPMSVWMTPDLKPFFGGTYFPPRDQQGRPGFATICRSLGEKWKSDRQKLLGNADKLLDALTEMTELKEDPAGRVPTWAVADKAFKHFETSFDGLYGGFGGEPKFPTPVIFNFLLAYHDLTRTAKFNVAEWKKFSLQQMKARLEDAQISLESAPLTTDSMTLIAQNVFAEQSKRSDNALTMARFTLRAIAKGGIHDHIGNGFHRYATDRLWHVPHFEKMLYDQAQLLTAYVDAFRLTKNQAFADVAKDILTYVNRDLAHSDGGYYSAEDADSLPRADASEKLEGAFAVWSSDELDHLLGENAEMFRYHYGVEENGNVPVEKDIQGELCGLNVLIERNDEDDTARQFETSLNKVHEVLKQCREKLAHARKKRPPPHKDDKIVTSWNGLMISGLARAFQGLGDEESYKNAARSADFLRKNLYDEKRKILLRAFREGPADIHGTADDYAFLISGLIDLYQCKFEERFLEWAVQLQDKQNELFWDNQNSGYFGSANTDILLRLKDDHDGAEPSSNSVSVSNLIKLAVFVDKPEYQEKAHKTLSVFHDRLMRYPQSMPQLLVGLMQYLKKPQQVIVVGSPADAQTQKFIQSVHREYMANAVLVMAQPQVKSGYLWDNSEMFRSVAEYAPENEVSAHVCQGFTCGMPVKDPENLIHSLKTVN